jgi:ribosomal protein S27AE
VRPLANEKTDREMKCPKCGLYSLRDFQERIACSSCGYQLSPGEATKFRLFRLLEKEDKKKRGYRF